MSNEAEVYDNEPELADVEMGSEIAHIEARIRLGRGTGKYG